ncbi:MAG: protein translocase subunit SecF [Ruminococcus sp.]|nr:protein translocase subunit SecF [Ruminococcus sp.]
MSKNNKKTTAPAVTGKIYDFCSKKRLILIVAVCVVIALLAGIIIRGVNLAIEFKGGTMLTYSYTGDIDKNQLKSAAEEIVSVPVNIRTGESLDDSGYQVTLSFTSKDGLNADRQFELNEALTEKFPDNQLELFDSNDVSPASGREFLLKCLVAMILAALLIIIYIALRFKKIGGWSAGVCSIFALCHDLAAALAASIIFGFEFNANIVAVILTILGYSINNTIVIYDRIRENRALYPKASLNELINMGCSQSLRRSIRTSVTTIGTMVVISVVVLISGYTSLLSFSVPLIFGLISGTYSSIFVAPVTWSWWKGRKPAQNDKKN